MNKSTTLEKTAYVFVFLIGLLQLLYAVYAYFDPAGFSVVRGTALFNTGDADWVQIYASRTLFVALIIAYLLYTKNLAALSMAALLGAVMPLTDAWLACQAQAPDKVVLKHIATLAYLMITFVMLKVVIHRQDHA